MESEQVVAQHMAVGENVKSELGKPDSKLSQIDASRARVADLQPSVAANGGTVLALQAARKEVCARYDHYKSVRARVLRSKAKRERKASAELPENPLKPTKKRKLGYETQEPFAVNLNAPSALNFQSTHMADLLLHGDSHSGHAGPGTISLDCDGSLSLARDLSGIVLCVKFSYIDEINPIWNIPDRNVAALKKWVNRQFVASQDITPMPKLNPRAVTTLDEIWKFLAEFDANSQHRSAIIRVTPLNLESRIPLVEASVTSRTHLIQPTTSIQESNVIAQEGLAEGSNRVASAVVQEELALVTPINNKSTSPDNTLLNNNNSTSSPNNPTSNTNTSSQNADMPLHVSNVLQQLELTRLQRSTHEYALRVGRANDTIRALRNEVRDAQKHNNELQEKYDATKKRIKELVEARDRTKAPLPDLTVPTDSLQQASELSGEMMEAAINLANIVEAYGTIRPGVTERTLQELQLTVDILVETAKDIEEEPVAGEGRDVGGEDNEVGEGDAGEEDAGASHSTK